MRVVRLMGRELSYAAPSELTIGNLVRRVLFVIREEHAHHHLSGAPQQYAYFYYFVPFLKKAPSTSLLERLEQGPLRVAEGVSVTTTI